MNDCNTEIILCSWKDCLWSCYPNMVTVCSVSAAARTQIWMFREDFFKSLLDTGEVLVQIYQYLSKYAHLAFKSPNIRTLFSEYSYMNTNKPQQIWLNMNVCFYFIHSLYRISMWSRRLQRIKLTQYFNFPHPPQPVYLCCKYRVYCPLLRNQTAGVKRRETERDFVLLSICSL